jgi:hypothetical protein
MPTIQDAFIQALKYAAMPMTAVQDASTMPQRQAIAQNTAQDQANMTRNLGTINVHPQQQASQMPSLPQPTPRLMRQGEQSQNGLWEILKAIAPQLISAGVGLAAPSTLPMAAGFSGGFTGEQQRKKLSKEEGEATAGKYAHEKELKSMEGPSWGQNQKIQMVKDALKRKSISISKEFGEPLDLPIPDENTAVRAIQLMGFDPTMFSKELADAYGLKQANLTTPSKNKTTIMTDKNGKSAEVEVDESGKAIRVIREL